MNASHAMPSTAPAQNSSAAPAQVPLDAFSQCHAGIIAQLQALHGLPALLSVAQQVRAIATDTQAMFEGAVLQHHADEEKDLFPAVIDSATPGAEREHVRSLAQRLAAEHRALESQWKRIAPAVHAAAKGKAAQLDAALTQALVHAYLEHARFEEQVYLPLAHQILSRNSNHMAALGLSLHIRHMPPPVGHI